MTLEQVALMAAMHGMQLLPADGLGVVQQSVLCALRRGVMSSADVGRQAHCETRHAWRVCRGLELRGLVRGIERRHGVRGNLRAMHWTITPAGAELARRIERGDVAA